MANARLKIYSATSFVGHGVDKDSLDRAAAGGLDAIIAQGTTTDAGPYYLGAGKPVMAAEALRRDLELIITTAKRHSIPFIVSAGGSGSDATTALVLELIQTICDQHSLALNLGIVYADVSEEYLQAKLAAGVRAARIVPHSSLEPELTAEMVAAAVQIVAQVGPEVVMDLWQSQPDLDGIVCGRSLDVGLYAALPLLHGIDKGLAMHFGKIMEDGALAATPGSGHDGLLGIIDENSFTVTPMNPNRRCTPESVTGHSFYERSDPNREANPGGDLDISDAVYEAVNERTVKVSGARWVPAPQYTVKLEGVVSIGFRSICIAGVRDPIVLQNIDTILRDCANVTREYFSYLEDGSFCVEYKVYGRDAIMGLSEPSAAVEGHEICVLMEIIAKDQILADSICSFFSSTVAHHGFPGRLSTAGNIAIPFSPGRAVSVGEAFRFSIWHALPLDDPGEPFAVGCTRITPGGGGTRSN